MGEETKKKLNDVNEVLPKAPTQDEVEEAELRAAELELRKLEIKAKKAELQDLEERLAEREMKRENKRQRSLTNGQTLAQLKAGDAISQKRCNHRKGGNGQHGIVNGKGDDSQFAVLKHQMANGDIWVRCLRCGKTWKPPIRENYKSEEAYDIAVRQHDEAVNFQTRNVMSGSVMFRFSDNGEHFRKVMEPVSLR